MSEILICCPAFMWDFKVLFLEDGVIAPPSKLMFNLLARSTKQVVYLGALVLEPVLVIGFAASSSASFWKFD
jgi:hypothetical protein